MQTMVPLYGFGGGGTALNFKVLAYATKDALLAAAPVENTIGIITNTPITSWLFSTTEPSPAAAGMVWITVGTFGNVGFNALKKNGIQVYPIRAKQYASGAWVDVSAKIYQAGAWIDWFLYLFKSGVGEVIPLAKYSETNTTIKSGTDSIICKNTSTSYYMTAVYTVDKIDLSNYETLYVDARLVANRSNAAAHVTRCYVWDIEYGLTHSANNVAPDCYTLFTPDGVRRVYQLDISSINSKMYVGVLGNATELEIYDMWLE